MSTILEPTDFFRKFLVGDRVIFIAESSIPLIWFTNQSSRIREPPGTRREQNWGGFRLGNLISWIDEDIFSEERAKGKWKYDVWMERKMKRCQRAVSCLINNFLNGLHLWWYQGFVILFVKNSGHRPLNNMNISECFENFHQTISSISKIRKFHFPSAHFLAHFLTCKHHEFKKFFRVCVCVCDTSKPPEASKTSGTTIICESIKTSCPVPSLLSAGWTHFAVSRQVAPPRSWIGKYWQLGVEISEWEL